MTTPAVQREKSATGMTCLRTLRLVGMCWLRPPFGLQQEAQDIQSVSLLFISACRRVLFIFIFFSLCTCRVLRAFECVFLSLTLLLFSYRMASSRAVIVVVLKCLGHLSAHFAAPHEYVPTPIPAAEGFRSTRAAYVKVWLELERKNMDQAQVCTTKNNNRK